MSKIGPEEQAKIIKMNEEAEYRLNPYAKDEEEPVQFEMRYYIRNRDDRRDFERMWKADDMSILLWNIQQGINSMRNGKNSIEWGFYRYTYEKGEEKEMALDTILDRMSEWLNEELAMRGINLED